MCEQVRAIFIPVIIAYGSVLLFIQSVTAVDVVLNSLAIAFILDMDDFFYFHFCGTAESRRAFEDRPGAAAAAGRTRANMNACLWLIYSVDGANLLRMCVCARAFLALSLPWHHRGLCCMACA